MLHFSHIGSGAFILLALLVAGVLGDVPFHTDLKSYQDGALGNQPNQTFNSSPVKAPIYQVNKFDYQKVDHSPYFFLTGAYAAGFGPSIVSSKDLSLIWADENYGLAQAARPYSFKGQRVLCVFAGGAVRIYNQHYQQLYQVRPQGNLTGFRADSHEAHITENDTVVLFASPGEDADLSSIGGPKKGDKAYNNIVQEIDPVTNELLFQFSTLDFFSISDTNWPYRGKGVYDLGTGAFDFAHMNSASKTPEGDFLLSYRHLSCIVLVDGKTSKVKWVMGGKRNQFRDVTEKGKFAGNASFSYQHEPRRTGKNRFTLFDNKHTNNGFCRGDLCSRGLELEYDPSAMTVKVVNEWYHPQSLISASRGGVQRLPNGNTLIAWGQNPMYTEYTPEGELVMDIQRGPSLPKDHGLPPVLAYRAWKGDWEGRPLWGPNISANRDETGEQRVYVSWNGATDVKEWALLVSENKLDLDGPERVVAYSPRMGFETSFILSQNVSFARIAAINKDGHVIGSTPAVEIRSGQLYTLGYEVSNLTSIGIEDSNPASVEVPHISAHTETKLTGFTLTNGAHQISSTPIGQISDLIQPPVKTEPAPTKAPQAVDINGQPSTDAASSLQDQGFSIRSAPFFVAAALVLAFIIALVYLVKKQRSGYQRLNSKDQVG